MIRKYKENVSEYLGVCWNCKSKFTFQYGDMEVDRYNNNKSVKCPYCGRVNTCKKLKKPMKKKYIEEIKDKESYEKIIAELREELTEKEKEYQAYKEGQDERVENQARQLRSLDSRIFVLKHIANDIKSKITPVLRDIENRKGVISKKMVVEHLQSLIDYIDERNDN